jgi:RHS repeat-associated protein
MANTYAANGPVLTRNGYLGTGTTTPFSNAFKYSFDGEGRPNALTDMTIAKAIWSGTTYNAASQPDQVAFYSGDNESFTWDWRTDGSMRIPGSLLSWTSSVGTGTNKKQQTGTLTWNENGTLQILQINDGFNAANTQNCNYGYDDLARVSSALCGTGGWGQNFSYDAYGNINKTVPQGYTGVVFNPGPYAAGNHLPGYNYDAGTGYNGGNGNLTNDGSNTYTYSVYNRPATVANSSGTTTAVYDALKRTVELQAGSGNTQLLYAPDGLKFAYMNGQTLKKYQVPLTAGVQTVYTAATPAAPAYWLHSDWLGSARLSSSPGQTVLTDQAYAPFGEDYDVYFHGGSHEFTGQTQDITAGIYDFQFRQYNPTQGRWMVPDPAGSAAVDITNPQTWNRYGYLANNPLNSTDPLGLYCAIDTDTGETLNGCTQGAAGYGWGAGEWDVGWQGGWSKYAFPIFLTGLWDVLGNIGSGGGGGGGYNPPPSGGGGGGGGIANFPNGESLGIPNGLPTNPWGTLGAVIPNGNCADLGPCVPIGNGIGPGWVLGGVICEILEPCGIFEDIGVGLAVIGTAYQLSKTRADNADCAKEWEDAYRICTELLSRPNPPRGQTGGHKDLQSCAKGYVSERCGGNRIDWGGGAW